MIKNEIKIPRKLASELLTLAQNSPEKEICGLISSKNNEPFRCYPVENKATQSNNRFLFDEKQHISAIKKIRDNGEAVFAIYHSHPSAPAFPSALDLEMANSENTLYFIISLNVKGILELRAFHIENKNVSEIKITL